MNSEELQDSYGRGWPKTREYAVKVGERLIENMLADIRNSYELVREFMEVFGHPVYDKPQNIEDKNWEYMRLELIREELCELYEACGYDPKQIREAIVPKVGEANIVKTADALGDLEYVINGMALGTGINLPAVVKEIHRSNMTKLGPDGKPIYREDGKILKGEGYEPPNLEAVLGL